MARRPSPTAAEELRLRSVSTLPAPAPEQPAPRTQWAAPTRLVHDVQPPLPEERFHEPVDPKLPRLLTPTMARDRSGLSLKRLLDAARDGTCPAAVRLGGRWLFHRARLDAWLDRL